MQTRKQSLVEAIANVLIGYFVAVGAQIVFFPLLGYEVRLRDNFIIGLLFTVVSIVRSYLVRRLFNRIHHGQVWNR